MSTRLYRSRTDRVLGGVCGGLGRYLGIDPTFVRLFFILLTLGDGMGLFIYFLLWIIVPEEGAVEGSTLADNAHAAGEELRASFHTPHPQAGLYAGIALVLLGAYFLARNFFPWLHWLDFEVIWPVLLIVGGLALLLRRPVA